MQTKTRALRLSDAAWSELELRARSFGYRGRAEYLESLASSGVPAEPVKVTTVAVTAPAPMAVKAREPARMTLGQVVAKWPDKMQEKWKLESWKAKSWCELVLDTIYGD